IVETFLSDRGAIMKLAAEQIAAALKAGLDARGSACAALSGGATPGPAYDHLAALALDWRGITFALVDERCVPASDPGSNEGLLTRTLAPALAGGAKVLPMYAGSTSPDEADAAYAPLHIDIALMGMGGDGHTASWFPGSDGLAPALDPSNPRTVVAVRAPQAAGAADRLTLSRAAIDRVDHIILLFTGDDKHERFEAALAQSPEDAPVPALLQRPGRPVHLLWAP